MTCYLYIRQRCWSLQSLRRLAIFGLFDSNKIHALVICAERLSSFTKLKLTVICLQCVILLQSIRVLLSFPGMNCLTSSSFHGKACRYQKSITCSQPGIKF